MDLRNAKNKQFNLGKLVLLVALSSLAVLVSLIVTSCQNNISVDPVMEWHHLAGDAKQIKDATVTVFDGRSSWNAKVQENGAFELHYQIGARIGNPWVIFITKEDYLPYIKNVPTSDFGPLQPLESDKVGILTGVCYLTLADRKSRLFGRIGDYKSNVKITARNKEHEYKFTSNSDGIFVQQLPEGEYTLEGEFIKPGTKVKILNSKTTIKNIKCGECDKIRRIKR